MNIDDVRALRVEGNEQRYLQAAKDLAGRELSNVEVQIEAAYACDRFGDEADAILYYDAAQALGVPPDKQRGFLVGYGSTLRNVGRPQDAIDVLTGAVEAHPDYLPFQAFLSLALYSAGEPAAAMAALLGALLSATQDSDGLDGYDRALAHYRSELVGE